MTTFDATGPQPQAEPITSGVWPRRALAGTAFFAGVWALLTIIAGPAGAADDQPAAPLPPDPYSADASAELVAAQTGELLDPPVTTTPPADVPGAPAATDEADGAAHAAPSPPAALSLPTGAPGDGPPPPAGEAVVPAPATSVPPADPTAETESTPAGDAEDTSASDEGATPAGDPEPATTDGESDPGTRDTDTTTTRDRDRDRDTDTTTTRDTDTTTRDGDTDTTDGDTDTTTAGGGTQSTDGDQAGDVSENAVDVLDPAVLPLSDLAIVVTLEITDPAMAVGSGCAVLPQAAELPLQTDLLSPVPATCDPAASAEAAPADPVTPMPLADTALSTEIYVPDVAPLPAVDEGAAMSATRLAPSIRKHESLSGRGPAAAAEPQTAVALDNGEPVPVWPTPPPTPTVPMIPGPPPPTAASGGSTASGTGQHHESYSVLAVLNAGPAVVFGQVAGGSTSSLAGHVIGGADDPGSRPA